MSYFDALGRAFSGFIHIPWLSVLTVASYIGVLFGVCAILACFLNLIGDYDGNPFWERLAMFLLSVGGSVLWVLLVAAPLTMMVGWN